jgi:hypothetical protein
MNLKSLFSNVKSSVSEFDFSSAGKTVVDTAKVMPGIVSLHASRAKVHYMDLKRARAARPKVINCTVERMPEKD